MVRSELPGPVDLFKFLTEIVETSMECPSPEFMNNLIMLLNKILSCFQKEFTLVVDQAEDMEMQIFCALTNSNIKFMGLLKTFIHKISKFGILSEEEVAKVVRK